MQRYILPLFLLLSVSLPAWGQGTPLSIARTVVSGAQDTVMIYFINNTNSPMEVGSVNLSLVFDGNEASLQGIPYSIFADEWGTQAQRSIIEPGNFMYQGNAYSHRWQYGNTSASFFNPTTVELTQTNGQPTLAMKVVFDYTGSGVFAPHLEDEVDNFINQQGDAQANPIPWTRTTLAAGTFPVEWLAFEATYAGDQTVALTWTTASESQNRAFQIERSENGRDFVYLGEVEGQGNSTEAHDYHFLDRRATAQRYYYRLRQVDFDGSFSYSDLREVRLDGSLRGSLLLYPNPAHDQAFLSGLAPNQGYTLRVLDLTGRVCQQMTQPSNAAGTIELDVRSLATGLYQVQLTGQQDGTHLSRKLVRE